MSKKITQAQINYIHKYGAKKAVQKYDELDLSVARRIEDEEEQMETFKGKRTLNKSKNSSRKNKRDDDEDLYESGQAGLHNLSMLSNNNTIASTLGMPGMEMMPGMQGMMPNMGMPGMMPNMGMPGMMPNMGMPDMLNPQASGMPIDPNMFTQPQAQPNMSMFMGANGKVDPLHVEVMAPTMFGNMNQQQMNLPAFSNEFAQPQMAQPMAMAQAQAQAQAMTRPAGQPNLANLSRLALPSRPLA